MSDVGVAILLEKQTPHQRELALVFEVMSDAQKIFLFAIASSAFVLRKKSMKL